MVLYTASCEAIYTSVNGSFVITQNRCHMCRTIFHNFDFPVSQKDNGIQYKPLNCAIFPPIHVIKSLSQYALPQPHGAQSVRHDAFGLNT